jgi:hypothetical protein
LTDDRPDVRLVGPEEAVLNVEQTLGKSIITELAHAARQHDVMISLTVSPYTNDEGEVRDPNDA